MAMLCAAPLLIVTGGVLTTAIVGLSFVFFAVGANCEHPDLWDVF